MNWIFQTPDELYGIILQRDFLWNSIFGDIPIYLVCKYDDGLHQYNIDTNYSDRLSDYIIIKHGESLEDCFDYLKRNKIIPEGEGIDF